MISITTNKRALFFRTLLSYMIFNGLLGYGLLRSDFNFNWILLLSINVLITLSILFFGYLDSISLNGEKLVLIYKNWIKVIRIREYSINSLKYTYKCESISYRGGFGKTLRLYIAGKKILKIHFNYDGWTEDKLDELVKNLDSLGVQRKFIGYSLKDEYPI